MSGEVIIGDPEVIHSWFGLTYANYLVLPRSVLQSMPEEWQRELVALLEKMERRYGHLDWPSYRCNAVDPETGRFMRDPIPHCNRGRTRIAQAGGQQ